jgi:hypothetical protein
MSSKKEMERLEKLEAEAAALDQRIARLESQITDMERQGREAFRAKNMRTAKEKARCLKVLGKQLDQLSAMKINIFECLQSEQMRQFVTGYAEAIRPVSDGRSLSIAAAEASINGTMDFMEQVGELTEVVTDTDLSGSPVTTFADELEELFGGDDGDGGQKHSAQPTPSAEVPAFDVSLLPDAPHTNLSANPGKKPPPTTPETELEQHLAMINL